MRDEFLHRKNQILNKSDKSFKQSIDLKILDLCNIINQSNNFYTTSSCSGRVIVKELSIQKSQNVFLYTTHNIINQEEIINTINELDEYNFPIEIRQESIIIHIVCRDTLYAQELMQIAKHIGCNHCGIISIKKWGIVVECICDISLSSIIFEKNFINENLDYITQLCEEMNNNLEKTWNVITKFEEEFKSLIKHIKTH